MELESELGKAFYGVYNSSREIVKNNQRNLFCNMLDLLSRTMKTMGEKCSQLEECMLFWVRDILPLVFDEDKDIQKSAIVTMEIATNHFKFKNLTASIHWNEIKTKIVQEFSKKICAYKESSSSHWYRIWCILIKILDKEIMKGASTINTFLSIVELGFRSPDYSVRIEAFYCWKVLIEVFANNGEICSPKRLRLICIPLKSSHSKTSHAAVVKLRVWWFLITKIGENIEQHTDTVLEPFLVFCCGLVNKNNPCVIDFKTVATLCMISILGSPTKSIKKKMNQYDIDNISQPIMNKNIMNKCWILVLTFTAESIKDSYEIDDLEDECSELLFRYILTHITDTGRTDILHFFFEKLPNASNKHIVFNIQKFVKMRDFSNCVNSGNSTYIGSLLFELCKYIIPSKLGNVVGTVEELVGVIFSRSSDEFESVLDAFLRGLFTMPSHQLANPIDIWKIISGCLIKCFGKFHQQEYNTENNILLKWMIWPLEACLLNREYDFNAFDGQFEVLLQSMFELGDGVISRPIVIKEMSQLFRRMLDCKISSLKLNSYFLFFMKSFFSSYMLIKYDDSLTSVTLELLKMHVSGEMNQIHIDLCMNCFKALIIYMGESAADKYIDDIKSVWLHIVDYKRKNITQSLSLEEYKRQLLDEIKKMFSKEAQHRIKSYLENDDKFVIIPAVWSLNPDKLTTRQRERLLEKSDNIPALYNDMSQSQDTFIKPWTPQKIVIAQGHIEEISITEKVECGKLKDTVNVLKGSTNLDNEEDIQHLENNVDIGVNGPVFYSDRAGSKESSNFLNSQLGPINDEINEIQTKQQLEDSSDPVDAIILKDTSSPPDRKQTNNSTSPLLKPKTTHLTGRGAQLINMIRNKKHENYISKQIETSTPVGKSDQNRERVDEYLNWSCTENESKSSPKNLLVFSKTLPPPCASPSASILKRKHHDSLEDVYYSQVCKRKRVSFHDPPVSVTREYLRDEENKNSPKRCLLMDQESRIRDQGSSKLLLKRSTKIDTQFHNESHIAVDPQPKKNGFTALDESTSKMNADSHSSMLKTTYPYIFRTDEDILNFVTNQFSIEEICEKYLSNDKTGNVASNLSMFISANMSISSKLQSKMLGTLAEKHPMEFLDYAIRENLSSTVCDRLSSNSIIDYIFQKSITNVACRARLFEEMQNILNFEKFSDERADFVKKIIISRGMTDQELLSLIELLFENKRKHQRAVSESAIDSSSML